MIGLLAHGGVGGAVVEIGLVLTILAVFFVVWRRERATRNAEAATASAEADSASTEAGTGEETP